MSDKDKETLKEHVDKVAKSPEGEKAQDAIAKGLKTAGAIANSPEAKVVAGVLGGDDAKDKLNTAGNIIDTAAKSPVVVGERNASKK